PILGVDADVPAVEQRVHVRSQQNAVVESVLATLGQRQNMSSLQNGANSTSSNGAATFIGIQHDRLECGLPQPLRSQALIAVDWAWTVPCNGQVDVNLMTNKP